MTYKLQVALLYTSPSSAGASATFTLSYREQYDSAWVQCDTAAFTTKSTGGTDSIELGNIPAGCHSVQLAVSTGSGYIMSIKTHNDTTWGPTISYGSGNDGWNQDYQTDVDIRMFSD